MDSSGADPIFPRSDRLLASCECLRRLVESAQSAVYAAGLVLIVATLSLVISFISRDFEIAYVAAHSDLAMANRFTWVAFYAGNEGSLLYIATVLSVMSAIAVWRAPKALKEAMPYTTAVLMLVFDFFHSCYGYDGQSV
ncbi:MAG: hypothetical protein CM1200mP27_01610 [Chloroflexota bacterium]|nr:MAG: hypothetical protein CM1200mP27_01610 [Chloroflexota bacterium]